MGRYFGTDGMRGEAGAGLTAEHAFKIGRYLGYKHGKILIARDTRHSGQMLESALAAGITSEGGNVYLMAVSTTPSVSYVVRNGDFDCGIMITASHNPYSDNGIKIIDADGAKLGDSEISDIEDYIDGIKGELSFAAGRDIGTIVSYTEGTELYKEYLIGIGLSEQAGRSGTAPGTPDCDRTRNTGGDRYGDGSGACGMDGACDECSDGEDDEDEEALEELLESAERYFAEARGDVAEKIRGRQLPGGDEEDEEYGECDEDGDAAGADILRRGLPLYGHRVALDCANGAASGIAAEVFGKLGADVYTMGDDPDGFNINEGVGSTHIEALGEFVRGTGCEIGFAYDGDADRCLAVDEGGHPISGDQLMYACAKYLRSEGRLKGDTLTVTVMSNLGLLKALEREGIKYETTRVGDRYVWECMEENGYSLGGEQSGHIIFSEYACTGDGILTSVMVMKALGENGASSLISGCPMYPQTLKNLRVPDKEAVMGAEETAAAIREAEERLDGRGRILVRASGTEPLVRVMAEAPDKAVCDEICDMVIEAMKSV